MGLAIIDSVIGLAAPLLDKFVVDKDKKAEFEHELKMVLHNANLQQNQINLEQAKTIKYKWLQNPPRQWLILQTQRIMYTPY